VTSCDVIGFSMVRSRCRCRSLSVLWLRSPLPWRGAARRAVCSSRGPSCGLCRPTRLLSPVCAVATIQTISVLPESSRAPGLRAAHIMAGRPVSAERRPPSSPSTVCVCVCVCVCVRVCALLALTRSQRCASSVPGMASSGKPARLHAAMRTAIHPCAPSPQGVRAGASAYLRVLHQLSARAVPLRHADALHR
jgi:hypothetical protein